MLHKLDKDGSGMISSQEFAEVFEDPDAQSTLKSLEVDPNYLTEMHKMIFPTAESHLTIHSIMELILQCRGDRIPTVKDLTDWLGFHAWKTRLLIEQHEEQMLQE